jgi:hypothetical protein
MRMRTASPLQLLWILSLSSVAVAQTPERVLELQQQALTAILNAADRICQTAPLDESSSKVQLNGTAKAEVNGVLKKLTDLGISGAANYESEEARGVAHAQLADAIAKGNDCKRDVLRELKTMIPGLAAPDSAASHNSIGDFSATRINDGHAMFVAVQTTYTGDHGNVVKLRFCVQQGGTSMCTGSAKVVGMGPDKVGIRIPMSAGGFVGASFDSMRPMEFQVCFVVPISDTNDVQAFGCQKFRYPTSDDPEAFLINR